MTDRGRWIDASMLLRPGMPHWPGDPPFAIERVRDMDRGDTVNLSQLSLGAHSGTHVDAPVHFWNGGAGSDRIPLDALIGQARVIGIRAAGPLGAAEFRRHRIAAGERILLRTRNSLAGMLRQDVFAEEFVHLAADAAACLVERGIRTLGVDALSVGGYRTDGPEVHRRLLAAGIVVIEGIDLSGVTPGRYDMICLPLKILGSDGAPARMILRKARSTR